MTTKDETPAPFHFCATRAIKNAKQIKSVAPHLFPAVEPPLDPFFSVLPFDVLNRFHRMTDDELRQHPHLLEAAIKLRRSSPPQPQAPSPGLFSDSPFQGTLYLVKVTFRVGGNSFAISDANMQTILRYATLAAPVISKYASQYGRNRLVVSSDILELTADVPTGVYTDDNVRGWVAGLLGKHALPPGQSCIVVFNAVGVRNTRASGDTDGYHDAVTVERNNSGQIERIVSPYCFVNVHGQNLTVQDRGQNFADTLSHEVAEMLIDPSGTPWLNAEICDACAGNCHRSWQSFFVGDASGQRYLRSAQTIPPFPFEYDFFTAAVAQSPHDDDCPAPDAACNYGPEARPGISELVFYEPSDGYGEVWGVNPQTAVYLQTTHPEWGKDLSLIVPGVYTSKPLGSHLDLLFYDRTAGVGEFYQTGNRGDMRRFSRHDNWRTSWTHIIPGSFAAPGSMDLLFYDQTNGVGEFYHTDGNGNLTQIGPTHTDWLKTWSHIIPGKFLNSPYTSLLLYDSRAGIAEFYQTDGHGHLKFVSGYHWPANLQIIPGKFSNSSFTDLLVYNQALGVGQFNSCNGSGGLTRLGPTHTDWLKTWSQIIPGKFSNSPFTELLFYDRALGNGEFYKTDGNGHLPFIRGYPNWRTTWSNIVRL